MGKVKKAVIAACLLAVTSVLSFIIWTLFPVQVDVLEVDPAVSWLNKIDSSEFSYTEGYIEKDGLKLHYVTAGDGIPVLFLHGFPSYWLSFVRQLESFKTDYQVIAIDGLGVGRSDSPSDQAAYLLEPMSQHVMAVLDSLDIDKVHLVGHDWGAVFAMSLAQRYPERVLSVAGLSGPPANVLLKLISVEGDQRETLSYIERLKNVNPILVKAIGGQRAWKGAYLPLLENNDLSNKEYELFGAGVAHGKRINAHLNWYRANIPSPAEITDSDYWPSKHAVTLAPSLFIWGENDLLIEAEAIAELKRSIPEINLMPINDVGHWPHVESPEVVTNALRKHIQSASGDMVHSQ